MMKSYLMTLSNTVISILELLITLRILLKLLGARTAAPFVNWVYETSNPLLAPFEGMFPSSSISIGSVLEVSALFALLAYAFIGVLMESIILQLTVHTHK
jgi:uncharacterized protein YggT (Ycf19 family)